MYLFNAIQKMQQKKTIKIAIHGNEVKKNKIVWWRWQVTQFLQKKKKKS